MNFFKRFRAKQTDKDKSVAGTPPPLPKQAEAKTTDPAKPIQVNDAQYVSLIRALRPKIEGALRDLQVDTEQSRIPAIVGGKNKPAAPNQSPPAKPDDTAPDPSSRGPIV